MWRKSDVCIYLNTRMPSKWIQIFSNCSNNGYSNYSFFKNHIDTAQGFSILYSTSVQRLYCTAVPVGQARCQVMLSCTVEKNGCSSVHWLLSVVQLGIKQKDWRQNANPNFEKVPKFKINKLNSHSFIFRIINPSQV